MRELVNQNNLFRSPPANRDPLAETSFGLSRTNLQGRFCDVVRLSRSPERSSLIVATRGRSQSVVTFIFHELDTAQREAVEKIALDGSSHYLGHLDPVPALSRMYHALLYANQAGIEVKGLGGATGLEELANFFDEEMSLFTPNQHRKMFKVHNLGAGIYHVTFANQCLMSSAFLRAQEHFESPKFRGAVFSEQEVRRWYRTTRPHGEFSFYFDWGGFNIPERVFRPFRRGDFDPLSSAERALVETVAELPNLQYVISTIAGESRTVLRHELAHAFYHTRPWYRREANQILKEIDLSDVERFLHKHGYHRAQWLDEAHAYIGDPPEELRNEGVDPTQYTEAHQRLRKIFRECAAECLVRRR